MTLHFTTAKLDNEYNFRTAAGGTGFICTEYTVGYYSNSLNTPRTITQQRLFFTRN